MSEDMKKKISIVTGATGGLGREFVRRLLNEDIDEIWAVARNVDKLKKLKEDYGDKIIIVVTDLSQDKSLDLLEEMLQNSNPIVKYLINNAGGGRMGSSDEFSREEIESHVMVHCTTIATLCNLCIPYMQKGCHIINMASQSAFQPVPYINLYAASKAFVRSYSRALNVELNCRGIVTTVACPGWIKTELLEDKRNGKQIQFPAIALAEDVAAKILKDAKRGKDMSVYGIYVKWMHLLSKIFPHKLVMRTWVKQIKEYI
ncbi:MAG: SDR family NAD(P)-dependent oxidoreductase [Herbinix sp.]|nr:SDR family NAD(P)-dependent oxidoreductase [Herbinix sp.]